MYKTVRQWKERGLYDKLCLLSDNSHLVYISDYESFDLFIMLVFIRWWCQLVLQGYFLPFYPEISKVNGNVIFLKFQPKIEDYILR